MDKDSILNMKVMDVLKNKYDSMFSAEKKIANFILQNPSKAVDSNVSQLASLSGVSDATVVRMCHHIGYSGYYQFRIALAGEIGNLQSNNHEDTGDKKDRLEKTLTEYADNIKFLSQINDEKTIVKCAKMIQKCNQAHIIAIGNTTPLALYMGFRLGRLGIKCTYGIGAEYFINQINLAEKNDIIIAISISGASNQIISGLNMGKKKGLKSIVITSVKESAAGKLGDCVLLSKRMDNHFSYYKEYEHLNETAMIDALLGFVTDVEKIKDKKADQLELITAESKM